MKRLRFLGVILSVVCLGGTVRAGEMTGSQPQKLSVMSYNVENLFDDKKDAGKDDWTFLPSQYPGKHAACMKVASRTYRKECLETDWNDDALNLKLSQMARVITGEGKHPLPTFLALVEVENDNVVKQLNEKLGYKSFVITNSPDERGIDVALLYNEPQGVIFQSYKEHVVMDDSLSGSPTRNILEATFTVAGRPLVFFVNHWPSQGHPTESRLAAARLLHDRVAALLKKDAATAVIAVGDFNTIRSDSPNPFTTELMKDDILVDTHASFMASSAIPADSKAAQPEGTYYFIPHHEWNLLDRIFMTPNLLTPSTGGIQAQLASYRIVVEPFAAKTFTYNGEGPNKGSVVKQIPIRYNTAAKDASEAGFSDHFPVTINLQFVP